MLAAIDVGTNTIRLLIGSVADGRVDPRRYFRRITRLGGGFSKVSGLAEDAIERTLAALREADRLIKSSAINQVRAVGTEILRRADNAPSFLCRVRQQTSLTLEVLSGIDEARLGSDGVLSALDPKPDRCLIFDLGGGSTEFTLVRQGVVVHHASYPLGVVALAEGHRHLGQQASAIDSALERFVLDLDTAGLLDEVRREDCLLVGTAGTVTTLAAMHLEMDHYDWRRVNNLPLGSTDLDRLRQRIEDLPQHRRETLPGLEKGRGDLILPGLSVVSQLMRRLGKDRLTVSDFGLLEGVLLSLARGRQGLT